ncbi:restriction endonuclease subunit M [Neolewinella persica]|uniref:restriction endonuclease subunit M n=1 Tax=Neolewinella persica TaxID=70998 RepID=UPI0003661972|nr:N-6 DNA methylase [Neolewinella persica]
MDIHFRRRIVSTLRRIGSGVNAVNSIEFDDITGAGSITYNNDYIFVSPSTIGFTGYTTPITDEECVRAYLAQKLLTVHGYAISPGIIEFERSYSSVGRDGKGGRVDIIVHSSGSDEVFLFIECKAPSKYDSDISMIDGQLFRLSKLERIRPKNLVYYSLSDSSMSIEERLILVDTAVFPEYEDWDNAGQPIVDTIPSNYGAATKKRFAKVEFSSEENRPLNYSVDQSTFNRLRSEIHDVIWGGGGTNNNDVFVYITKIILCKIYDELETRPNESYTFQRYGTAENPEDADELVNRLNMLYATAETSYLALPRPSSGPAFDHVKVSNSKIAYVVGRLEGISVTRNTFNGDLLGEFFEQIVSQDFTQSKGQFFTPPKIVRFIHGLINIVGHAEEIMINERDSLGRHRLPYVIDPSCGSGTFLIEYMKALTERIGLDSYGATLSDRIREAHSVWFGGVKKTSWARDFLFGIENNYDLGLSAKVNMVLHGDGSMNTWINNGLLPFNSYWMDGRNNILGTSQESNNSAYDQTVNEQFDLIITNPPFSVTSSPDDDRLIQRAFSNILKSSEQRFIERWYQLLRPGGEFAAVLPENILDTSTNKITRKFLLKYFDIIAIISLPYDAFKPFTSTKTAIVYAKKKSDERLDQWQLHYNNLIDDRYTSDDAFENTVLSLDGENEIFMAEPTQIGYKRRKNLSDLEKPNQLYSENSEGEIDEIDLSNPKTVLDYFFTDEDVEDSELGFKVSVEDVLARTSYRLDPKYCFLWHKLDGKVVPSNEPSAPLSQYLEVIKLEKLSKGQLENETTIADLDSVAPLSGKISTTSIVDEINSDKVIFAGADLLFSKLEPYLGKVVILPPADYIGSPEWIGLKLKDSYLDHVSYFGYLLMHPALCEAYRRLQSGKRHARLDISELLELQIPLKEDDEINEKSSELNQSIAQISELNNQVADLEQDIKNYLI